MFRIAPASLAVLAIFNVASTLADGDFKVDFTVEALGAVISGPTFVYGGSGCGSGNDKCHCTLSSAGELLMVGEGTEGTATGLDFSCDFYVQKFKSDPGSAVKCSVHVEIPYSDSNSLTCDCAGYTFYGCDISSGGHDFTKNMALKPNDLQLDEPPSASTCEADLTQCNVDKVDNAVAVLSKLQSGTIKLVFA